MPKAIAQITIRDENDIDIGSTAPINPVKDQMWLDTSVNPSVLKRYNGSSWDIVNDVQVGGRNYILNGKGDSQSGFFKNFNKVEDGYGEHTLTSKKQYSNLDISSGFLLGCRDYEVGKTVVFSYDVMYTKWDFPEGTNIGEFWIGQRYTNSTTSNDGAWRRVTAHDLPIVGIDGCKLNEWFHVERVLIVPSKADQSIGTASSVQFYNSNADIEASVTFRIKDVKVEYGNKATDWTPAPEDFEEKIQSNTTAITVAQGQISGIISENTIVKGDITSLNDKYTSINATVDGINATVASQSTIISNLDDKVTTVETKQATLEQNLDGFKTTVSNTYSTKTEHNELGETVTNVQQRVNTVEQSITASAITTTISSAINSGTSSISTTQFIMDITGLTIKNGALKIQNNAGANVLYSDINGNLTFIGKLQPNDYQLRLFGNDCKIDGSVNAIRLQLTPQIYSSIDSSGYFRIYNQYSNGGNRYTSIGMGNDGHVMFFNNTTMLKLLGGVTPQVQARNTGDNAYVQFAGSAFINASSREFKVEIETPDYIDFISILNNNNIMKYKLKDNLERLELMPTAIDEDGHGMEIYADEKLGLILEELTEEARKYLNPNGTDGIDTYSMCSILWKVVQEQQNRIEVLESEIILKGSAK